MTLRGILKVLHLQCLKEKILCTFSRRMCPKTKFFAVKLRRILKDLRLQCLKEKIMCTFSRFMCPTKRLFAVKLRRILEVMRLQGTLKKFWAHFHDLCFQKRSCLLWGWEAFWKFCACKVYRKNCGRIFMIYASKIEAVCYEVETHFGSSLLTRYTEKILDPFSRFMHPKAKLFAVTVMFICIWEFLPCKVYETCSGCIFTISRVHKSMLFGPIAQSLTLHLLKCLESQPILRTSAPTNCDVQAWFQVNELFEEDLDWHDRHILWYLRIERTDFVTFYLS